MLQTNIILAINNYATFNFYFNTLVEKNKIEHLDLVLRNTIFINSIVNYN